MLTAAEFRRRFTTLILLAWTLPPVVGLSFILFTGILTLEQMAGILRTPLEPAYILGWLLFAWWYFRRRMQPVVAWLQDRQRGGAKAALDRMRAFTFSFWAVFLVYLLLAPSSVIVSAEWFTDYVARPVDWFRIHLVALIVSILVGLPIFFLILDLFGRALGDTPLERPHVTLRAKVFLIGALVPLLIDTMLVQYYWTRTGFFSTETFFVWLFLELLAVFGSLIFVRSFGQALAPLQGMVRGAELDLAAVDGPAAMSTDELGVLGTRFRGMLRDLRVHNEILALNNRLLRSAGEAATLPRLLDRVIELSQEAFGGDRSFLILHDEDSDELVGVARSGAPYREQGHFRLALDEVSMAVWVFHEGGTLAVGDARTDPRASPRMMERFGVRSVLAAPLVQEGRTIGVLMSTGSQPRQGYSEREIALMEGLAQEAALAVGTVRLNRRRRQAEQALQRHQEELEQLVEARTRELSTVNRELESFSYSVSHDLRGPLRAIDGFSAVLEEDFGAQLGAVGLEHVGRVRKAAQRMGELIDDLLELSRVSRADVRRQEIDFSALAAEVVAELRAAEPDRDVQVEIEPGLRVCGDPVLLRIALGNLVGNAWKYTGGRPDARIRIGRDAASGEYRVEDNGVGFDMRYAGKLFQPFQRLHGAGEFPGSGIGLATVYNIVQRHGGCIRADAEPGRGACFSFTLEPDCDAAG